MRQKFDRVCRNFVLLKFGSTHVVLTESDVAPVSLKVELIQLVCERFESRSHFKSRLSLIVWVNVVLNRTVVVDSD